MSASLALLAELDTRTVVAGWRSTRTSRHDFIVVLSAILLVTVLALVWAAFLRKRRRRRKHHAHRTEAALSRPAPGVNANASESVDRGASKEHRRRSRRERRRARNPTLAETGGLPPVRDQWPGSTP